jgi:SAM-dependent methyltransferase
MIDVIKSTKKVFTPILDKINIKDNILVHYWDWYFDIKPLISKLKLIKNPKILQIGHYSSKASFEISSFLNAKEYLVVDDEIDQVTQAEMDNPEKSSVIFQIEKLHQLDLKPSQYDLVIIVDKLHKKPEWKKLLLQARKVLKEKGLLVILDKSIESFTYPGIGLILRRLINLPYNHMYDQIELLTFIKKNQFEILEDDDNLFNIKLIARKKS